ncbi:MAG: low molecular weight protein-tyrosine-phosphatase [Desulfococcaceae bacterium]
MNDAFSQKPHEILVICTGNICRSPMGEGILRDLLRKAGLGDIRVASAGTSGWDNHPPTPEAVRACAEIGNDISGFRSAPLEAEMAERADWILAMEPNHLRYLERSFPGAREKADLIGRFHPERPGLAVHDPYGEPFSAYRDARDRILRSVEGLVVALTVNNPF